MVQLLDLALAFLIRRDQRLTHFKGLVEYRIIPYNVFMLIVKYAQNIE